MQKTKMHKLRYLNVMFFIVFIFSMMLAIWGLILMEQEIKHAEQSIKIIMGFGITGLISSLGYWTLESKWLFNIKHKDKGDKNEKNI